jgi:hypothetical protein
MFKRIGLGSLEDSPLAMIPELELWDQIVMSVYKAHDLFAIRLWLMQKRAWMVITDYAAEKYQWPRIYPAMHMRDGVTEWAVQKMRQQRDNLAIEWVHGARKGLHVSALTEDATWAKTPPVRPSASAKSGATKGKPHTMICLGNRPCDLYIAL